MITTYAQFHNPIEIECNTLEQHPKIAVVAVAERGVSQTDVFLTWEQLRELHIIIGAFMLDHPEKYQEESND